MADEAIIRIILQDAARAGGATGGVPPVVPTGPGDSAGAADFSDLSRDLLELSREINYTTRALREFQDALSDFGGGAGEQSSVIGSAIGGITGQITGLVGDVFHKITGQTTSIIAETISEKFGVGGLVKGLTEGLIEAAGDVIGIDLKGEKKEQEPIPVILIGVKNDVPVIIKGNQHELTDEERSRGGQESAARRRRKKEVADQMESEDRQQREQEERAREKLEELQTPVEPTGDSGRVSSDLEDLMNALGGKLSQGEWIPKEEGDRGAKPKPIPVEVNKPEQGGASKRPPEADEIPSVERLSWMDQLGDWLGSKDLGGQAKDLGRQARWLGREAKGIPAWLEEQADKGIDWLESDEESWAEMLGRGSGKAASKAGKGLGKAAGLGGKGLGKAGAALGRALPTVGKAALEFGMGFASEAPLAAAGIGALAAVPVAGAAIGIAQEVTGKVKDMAKGAIDAVVRVKDIVSSPDTDVSIPIEAFGESLIHGSEKLGMFGEGLAFAGEATQAFAHLMRNLDQTAQKYAEFSPEIAQAAALAEVRQTLGDLQRAQRVSEELAEYVTAKQDLQDTWEEIKIVLLKEMIPAVTQTARILNKLAPLLEAGGEAVLEPVVNVLASMAEGLSQIAEFITQSLNLQTDQKYSAVNDPTDQILHDNRFTGLAQGGNPNAGFVPDR